MSELKIALCIIALFMALLIAWQLIQFSLFAWSRLSYKGMRDRGYQFAAKAIRHSDKADVLEFAISRSTEERKPQAYMDGVNRAVLDWEFSPEGLKRRMPSIEPFGFKIDDLTKVQKGKVT